MGVTTRSFTTAHARYGLADIYDRVKNWRKAPAPEKLYDPVKEETADDGIPEDSTPVKLRVLGMPKNNKADWDSVKDVASFTAWPTSYHRSDLSTEQIESAVAAAFGSADLSNLSQRFQAIKSLSESLNLAIPDSVLSKVESTQDAVEYLKSVARPYNEKTPDAVYLNAEDFKDTNITISDPAAERKARRKHYKSLVRQARQAEEQSFKSALEN